MGAGLRDGRSRKGIGGPEGAPPPRLRRGIGGRKPGFHHPAEVRARMGKRTREVRGEGVRKAPMGTLAGAAPPWIETWGEHWTPSELTLELWPGGVPEGFVMMDLRKPSLLWVIRNEEEGLIWPRRNWK